MVMYHLFLFLYNDKNSYCQNIVVSVTERRVFKTEKVTERISKHLVCRMVVFQMVETKETEELADENEKEWSENKMKEI